jgi:tetratricopeptide (TPR) repeat protein
MLYQKAIAIVPMPTFVAELGDLYAKSGNQTEARKQYALVEYIGLLGRINQVLHNRDLALFYADHDMKLSEALDLAQKELEVRRDIYTWDALAWALYKNGKLTEAAEASGKALHFGTRDSLLLFHAGMIAEGLGQHEQARGELKQALEINPHFHPIYAEAAQQRLAALEKQSKSEEGSDQHGR